MFIRIILLLATASFIGCAASGAKTIRHEPISSVTPVHSEKEQVRASYIAKALVDSDDRSDLMETLDSHYSSEPWGGTSARAAQITSAVTDAAVGSIGTNLGAATGSAVYIGSLLYSAFSSDAHNIGSQFFMPKRFNGIEIQTPADAASAVISWYRKTVEQLAASNGWEVKCVLKCGESGMVFELDVKQELPFEYGAKPTKLMIRLLHDEFVEAPKDPILSSLLGFEPTFTTGVGNTFEFIVYAGGHNFKKVAPAINVVENGRIKVINMSKAHTLRIGRDVLRALHSTPYSFAGYNNSRSRFIVYNGTIYMMEAPKAGVFVSERVNERNLLMNNVRSDFN